MTRLFYLMLPCLLLLSEAVTTQYEVRYKLGSMNMRVVTLDISWEESEWNGEPAYHSVAVIQTVPFFRMFLGSYYYAECFFRSSDMAPIYFDNPFNAGTSKARRYEYYYHPEDETIESVSFHAPDKTEFATFTYDGRTMDFLSLVHFIRFLDESQAKDPMPMHILVSGKSYPAELQYLGPDPEKLPDTPSEKFLLRLTGRGLMENGSGNVIYVWRSISDHTLLSLETALNTGSIQAMIMAPKEPETDD